MKKQNDREVKQKGPAEVQPRKTEVSPKQGVKTRRSRLMLNLSQIWEPEGKLLLHRSTLINNALCPVSCRELGSCQAQPVLGLQMNPVLYQKGRKDAMITSSVDTCQGLQTRTREHTVCFLLLIWGLEGGWCGVRWH